LLSLLGGGVPTAASEPSARQLLVELQRLALDHDQTYKVREPYLRRDAARLYLRHGTLVFLEPVAGRVTGAVFEGTGQVLVLPPDGLERQQMARFTASPILTETFYSAFFRFSDDTFEEWLAQIEKGLGLPASEAGIVGRWATRVATLNRLHSLRTLLDFLPAPSAPYFYAAPHGERLGRFDLLVDGRRQEQVLVGQARGGEGQNSFDVWCSFARGDAPPPAAPARASVYRVEAALTRDLELAATVEADFEWPDAPQRILMLDLSRFLRVEEVAELAAPGASQPLEFFQNEALRDEETRVGTSDALVVLLPPGARRRTLRFRYRGRIVTDVGGGFLHVGSRDHWYPRPERASAARYELRFRVPRELEVAAVGRRESVREEGEWKESRWVTDTPVPVAGFNLGRYEVRELARDGQRVVVYANRALEPHLARAGDPRAARLPPPGPPPFAGQRFEPPVVAIPPAPPTAEMERVGGEVASALAYFSRLFGPSPYQPVRVTQSPGGVGQGFPGFLYLSTYSFLSEGDLVRLGLAERVRQHFRELTPAHEAAHQWWGNWARVPHYRDQWLAESLASYSALLFVEHQRRSAAPRRAWLDHYRDDLLAPSNGQAPAEATGALGLGIRLSSSLAPEGYGAVVYTKGPWVVHMLRELFRDPKTGSDQTFFRALGELARRGETTPLTTDLLQKQLESVLPAHADLEETQKLDWFFQQWVYATGVPHYALTWQVRGRAGADLRVEGRIEQTGVPEDFLMPVPVYARTGKQLRRLGRVVVTGTSVAFRFPVAQSPDELVLDPQRTVLAVLEKAERK
jgi:hypothetical protein